MVLGKNMLRVYKYVTLYLLQLRNFNCYVNTHFTVPLTCVINIVNSTLVHTVVMYVHLINAYDKFMMI